MWQGYINDMGFEPQMMMGKVRGVRVRVRVRVTWAKATSMTWASSPRL
jgi:hypothetical protein